MSGTKTDGFNSSWKWSTIGLFSVCAGELQVNIKKVSVGADRLGSCDGAEGEGARCTVY